VSGGVAPYRYSIDNPSGPFTTGTSSQTIFNITGQTGGTHNVYILDANGCATSPIVVNMNPSVNIRAVVTPKYYCPNDAVRNDITVNVNIAAVGQVTYSLDGAAYQPNNVFTNLSVGAHFIRVRHTNGCTTPDINFNITRVMPLVLNVTQGALNEIVSTTSGGYGGYTYTLNGGISNSTGSFIIDASGNYTVRVTDSNGCETSATIPIVFIDIFIPNVFTPNGDGNNDGWSPQKTLNYKNLVYHIFDRYGRKIKTGREGELWDGTYNGTELPSGDYWYVIKIGGESGDGRKFVGNVTLYR
jgi:gliding motility-associated-like protein